MWYCGKCRESVEDSFDVCWNCGTSRDGIEDPVFRRAPAHGEAAPSADRPALSNLQCLRCNQPLGHIGTKRFHEGTNWGALGEVGELFVKRQRFDVYVCSRCGHVELFVDGLGEAFRPL